MFIFIHFFFILLLAYFSNQDFTPLMHIIVVGLTITEKPVQNIILMTLCCKSLHSILPDQKKNYLHLVRGGMEASKQFAGKPFRNIASPCKIMLNCHKNKNDILQMGPI